jgi:hypothetical protein
MDRAWEVIGLFLCCGARLGIPLGLTLLVAWGLKRLDAHWQADAVSNAAQSDVRQVAVSQIRCWEMRGCSTERRQTCPAYRHPEISCWVAQSQNGSLGEACRDCHVLGRALYLAGV